MAALVLVAGAGEWMRVEEPFNVAYSSRAFFSYAWNSSEATTMGKMPAMSMRAASISLFQ